MNYAEIIYEDGSFGVASIEDGEEGMQAFIDSLANHHDRAKNALPIHNSWAPNEKPVPATRVTRVLMYDKHPADIPEVVSEDVAKKMATEAVKVVAADAQSSEPGTVDLYALADSLLPRVLLTDTGPHESNYVMKESDELDSALWGGEN